MQLVLIIETNRNFDWTTSTIGVGVLLKQVDTGLNFIQRPVFDSHYLGDFNKY
ncbi:hypothetical protein N644_0322 [Lactiplantibacillus paraplantarum]|nr:hypothetical protein N644_0322 [Lactiplantibacillus paraplantarum]KRL50143.1 hypothetical protein FD48_GL002702 [Lactiplantibacillus paraplantarum DSM 10667]